MMNPLISIIVPIYKVEEYLDMCVQSIVNQTYSNLEIILVDDGSPDKCPVMCDEWAKKDSRVVVIHKKNGGQSSARNAALEIARGEYIGFVDSDDFVAESMFEKLLEAIRVSGKKIANCTAHVISDKGDMLEAMQEQKMNVMNVSEAASSMFYGNINTAVWSKLFDRMLFEGVRFPNGQVNEEFPILLPLLEHSGGIANTGKPLYYYRKRPASTTATYHLDENKVGQVYKNLEIIRDQIDKYQISCEKAYRFFSAMCAFSCAFAIERDYMRLEEKIRLHYDSYTRIMRKYAGDFMFSRYSKIKQKVQYFLVLTRLVRPAYKLMNR